MNVSSLVVKVAPEGMDQALAALSASGLCEVHFHDRDKGMIVVTIEGKDTGEEMDKMKAVEKLPPVQGAALVYSYSETELAEAVKRIGEQPSGPVPEELRNA